MARANDPLAVKSEHAADWKNCKNNKTFIIFPRDLSTGIRFSFTFNTSASVKVYFKTLTFSLRFLSLADRKELLATKSSRCRLESQRTSPCQEIACAILRIQNSLNFLIKISGFPLLRLIELVDSSVNSLSSVRFTARCQSIH